MSAELEGAVLAALGQHIDAVITQDTSAQKASIAHLAEHQLSRALVANETVSPPARGPQEFQGPGWLGYLIDLIAPPHGKELLAHLLNDAFMVEDLESAYRLLDSGFEEPW